MDEEKGFEAVVFGYGTRNRYSLMPVLLDRVVRCGECRFSEPYEGRVLCRRLPIRHEVEPMGFCSWGEEDEDVNEMEVLRGPFDVETHKATFTDYLEVCIDPEGVVHYAVPSHQRWLVGEYMRLNGFPSEEDAWRSVPIWEDVLGFLARETGCIAVWNDRYVGDPNARQRQTMLSLASEGLLRLGGKR